MPQELVARLKLLMHLCDRYKRGGCSWEPACGLPVCVALCGLLASPRPVICLQGRAACNAGRAVFSSPAVHEDVRRAFMLREWLREASRAVLTQQIMLELEL